MRIGVSITGYNRTGSVTESVLSMNLVVHMGVKPDEHSVYLDISV